MMMLKLQTSDGTIMEVSPDAVKQMGTIHTMLENLQNYESDEIIPIKTISRHTLEKIIEWIHNHQCYHIRDHHQDFDDFFNTDIENIFKLIKPADYLDVINLVNESCRRVVHYTNNNELLLNKDLDKNAIAILEDYKLEYGYEVLVTIQFLDKEYVKYYNLKVSTR